MEKLEIRKNGKLIETKWVYDDAAEEGEYQEFDETSKAISKLFETCELADNVTLKDIFLLLDSEIEIFDAVLGNWCKELVAEGLDKPAKDYDPTVYDPDQIEYLELRLTPEYDDEDGRNVLYGLNLLDFGGVGVELQNDNDVQHYKKGERVPWGVSFTPVNELINIPVKLFNKLEIYEGIMKSKGTTCEKLADFDNPSYTLGQILYSIVWKLSFHGGPDSRQKFKDELQATIKDLNIQEEENKDAD